MDRLLSVQRGSLSIRESLTGTVLQNHEPQQMRSAASGLRFGIVSYLSISSTFTKMTAKKFVPG